MVNAKFDPGLLRFKEYGMVLCIVSVFLFFCFSCVHPLDMDSLFVNINIKFCSMTGSFIDEHLNGKIDKGDS